MRAEEFMKHVNDEGKHVLAMHKGEEVQVLVSHSEAEVNTTRVANNHVSDNMFQDICGDEIHAAIGKRVGESNMYDLVNGGEMKQAISRVLRFAHAAQEKTWFQGFPTVHPRVIRKPIKLAKHKEIGRVLEKAIVSAEREGCILSGACFSMGYKGETYNWSGRKENRAAFSGSLVYLDMTVTNADNTIESNVMHVASRLDPRGIEQKINEGIQRLQLLDSLPVRELPAGKYNAVLEGQAMVDVVDFLASALDGEEYHREGTFIHELDKRCFSTKVTITDEPFHRKNPYRIPTNTFGTPVEASVLVKRGRPMSRWYDFWTSQKYGQPPTGHGSDVGPGPVHLCLKTGNGPATMEDAVKKLGNGVYICDLVYNRMEDVPTGVFTGITRFGTFLVERGKITARLPNLRYVESLPRMLRDVNWLSSQDQLAFTHDLYGIGAVPILQIPKYTQVNRLNITGSTPVKIR